MNETQHEGSFVDIEIDRIKPNRNQNITTYIPMSVLERFFGSADGLSRSGVESALGKDGIDFRLDEGGHGVWRLSPRGNVVIPTFDRTVWRHRTSSNPATGLQQLRRTERVMIPVTDVIGESSVFRSIYELRGSIFRAFVSAMPDFPPPERQELPERTVVTIAAPVIFKQSERDAERDVFFHHLDYVNQFLRLHRDYEPVIDDQRLISMNGVKITSVYQFQG